MNQEKFIPSSRHPKIPQMPITAMSVIKQVAVVGVCPGYHVYKPTDLSFLHYAAGTVGKPVVAALLESGFSVMAITRYESMATFPVEVTVTKVDITSVNALTAALKGQDAVVSTLTTSATSGTQRTLIDAAVAAHVKRFIPSEFGTNTREARGTKMGKCIQPKIDTVDYLIELSKRHEWFT